MTIIPANTRSLDENFAGLPQMAVALKGWMQPLIFNVVTKSIVDFEIIEVLTPTPFNGVRQPLNPTTLALKPEGQRGWKWDQIHAEIGSPLNVDDVIEYNGARNRVMAKLPYPEYGYIEYHIVIDYEGVSTL